MATLKEMLQNNIKADQDEKDRKIKEANEKFAARQLKIKNDLITLIRQINNKLTAQIVDGKIPAIDIRGREEQYIIQDCKLARHAWQQNWDQFIKDWENQGIRIVINDAWDENNSWYKIKVEII